MTTFAAVADKSEPIGRQKICLSKSLLKVQYRDSRKNCKMLSKCVCLRKVWIFICFHLCLTDFIIRFHEMLVYIETASSEIIVKLLGIKVLEIFFLIQNYF